jgi:hypothetical protein
MEQALLDRAPAGRWPSAPTRFTPQELAAAEQLIHLSESSCSTGAAFTPRGSGTAASACYSSSSPRSVNAPAFELLLVGAEEEADDDEQEVGGRPRQNRRCRSIAELYDATEPAGPRRRKAKASAGAGGTMKQRRK